MPPEPIGWYQPEILAVEWPLVECHLDEAAANEHPHHQKESERVDLAQRQPETVAPPPQEEMEVEEPEGEAKPVPPEVETTKIDQHGIYPVDEKDRALLSPILRHWRRGVKWG